MPRVTNEDVRYAVGVAPIDINGGATGGDAVSMKNHDHLTIVIQCGVLGAATPAVTLQQSTAVAEGDGKSLGFSTMWTNAADIGSTDLVKTAVTSDTFDIAATADGGMYIIEVPGDTLDADNNFDVVSVQIADPSTSQLVAVLYILSGAKSFLNSPDVLVD
tara:strand:+ start:9073 stop:9555 length:483 start_codon:yes stop_codon:yes gene_type:complete